MKPTDLVAVIRGIAPVIREHVAAVVSQFGVRLEALEQRVAGVRDGRDGEQGPQGPPGTAADGIVGPQGAPGQPGRDGQDGKDGESFTRAQVEEMVAFAVAKAIEALPKPRDGRDGMPGVAGPSGEKGTDGINGTNGRDGLDGLGFDDVEEELEAEGRILVRRWKAGDRVKEIRHLTVSMIFRGVYQDGRTYHRGDVVTRAGSMWHANETTSVMPGEAALASRAWQLCVKKGNDGRQGMRGLPGDVGPRGERGNDGAVYR